MIRALVVASIRYLLARRSRLMAAFQRKEGMEVGEYARKETQKKIPLGFPRQASNSEYIYIYVYSERADHEEREIYEGEYPSLGGR